MEKQLDVSIVKKVQDVFSKLSQPVAILLFTSQAGCDYCEDATNLLQEVAELSDKLDLKVYDLEQEAEVARSYQIDKAPGIVIAAKDGDKVVDYGIRFYGTPMGAEFSTFINDLLLVSNRDSGLAQETRTALGNLKQPVHLQVFVTPTCPYCPSAVLLAHRMAMESPMVMADGVESSEFYDLANQYQISAVPNTVINDGQGSVLGAVPEFDLMEGIEQALHA
jgi:glutaredoxin-like protein